MSVDRLLKPRSLAIVGASDQIGPGFNAWNALKTLAYEGEIHLVNPTKSHLLGQVCYPSIAEIPTSIDAAFIAVQAPRVLDVARAAIDKGAGGLTILSSGFGEAGSDGAQMQATLVALARQSGVAICGPNCLGYLNFADRTALFGTSLPDQLPRGGVAAVVQSGSIGIALLNAARGIGLNHLITSGNEAATTTADYLEWLVDRPDVTLLIAFLEQLRDAPKFLRVCRRAKEAGKPVVVLKSGRTARGQLAVQAHTGAVAGSVEVCDVALAEAGAIQVFSLDELIELSVLFANTPGKPKAAGTAMVSLSGGQIALALDASEAAGLSLPPVVEAHDALVSLLPAGSHIANPLDLTWAGLYDPTIAQRCVEALARQDSVGSIALLQDSPAGLGAQQVARYSRLLAAVADGCATVGVPLVAMSNISGDMHPAYRAVATERGVASLRGTTESIGALARYHAWWDRPVPATGPSVPPTSREILDATAQRLQACGPARSIDEHAAKAVLAPYGIGDLRERVVTTVEDACAAAGELGLPVVLKGLVPDVTHKSELGLVALNLTTAGAVAEAADRLLQRARAASATGEARLLVQEMVSPVVELLVGARVDPDFGPVIVVGTGGIMVELYRDVALRLAPVTPAQAVEMIACTKAGQLMAGWRNKPAGDIEAAAEIVSAISRFIADFSSDVAEVEINPLAVLERGKGTRPLDCVLRRQ